jgi:hypothetical protein
MRGRWKFALGSDGMPPAASSRCDGVCAEGVLDTVYGLNELLAAHRCAGRGVLWCRTGDGSALGAYTLTGRTPASRERTLHRSREGELIVAPSDSSAHDRLAYGQPPALSLDGPAGRRA